MAFLLCFIFTSATANWCSFFVVSDDYKKINSEVGLKIEFVFLDILKLFSVEKEPKCMLQKCIKLLIFQLHATLIPRDFKTNNTSHIRKLRFVLLGVWVVGLDVHFIFKIHWHLIWSFNWNYSLNLFSKLFYTV